MGPSAYRVGARVEPHLTYEDYCALPEDDHVRRRRLGVLFHAPVDVLLAPDTVVQPDIVFVSRERRPPSPSAASRVRRAAIQRSPSAWP